MATDPPQRANRLIHEHSPYLLQHARQPVDWHPWGRAAFERARREGRPIFLSIGYSTCHWCHVMAHESFEDPEVAQLLNEGFVPVKVDREERPDVDQVYMAACQLLTGSGGWPLTAVLTPEGQPFFAGTYFPKESRWGRVGMLELLPKLARVWRERREEAVAMGQKLVQRLSRPAQAAAGGPLDERVLHEAVEQLTQAFDAEHGGFGDAPKFPMPHRLSFLLRAWRRTGEERCLRMVETTLRAMRRGGIYDQVGFGFHRYATDRAWRLPHFEKMLYDQASLLGAYTEAYQATRRAEYARTAHEIAQYVLRDLQAPEGGFFSAEDADSQGGEGAFYLWTLEEIAQALPPADAERARRAFGLRAEGNFFEEASGRRTGRNVLSLEQEPAPPELERLRRALYAARAGRARPARDEKILTDWNGLMIAALAQAARALEAPRYLEAAQRALAFLEARMTRPDGQLWHRYHGGRAGIPACLDDYAFTIWARLELYETTFEAAHLERALALVQALNERFWDREGGGFFLTADEADPLPVRPKEAHDGAVPSGNSVMVLNLMRLARLTASPELERQANALGRAFSAQVERWPSAHCQFLQGLDFALGPGSEVLVVGRASAADTRALLSVVRRAFAPHSVALFKPEGSSAELEALAPWTRPHRALGGRATAYVCQAHRCQAPVTAPEALGRALGAA